MNRAAPIIRYTGLFSFVEAYAKDSYSYPLLSLFGAKNSVQAIASALVSRTPEVLLDQEGESQEVWMTPGAYKLFSRTLPCGANHALVINTRALHRYSALPSFYIVSREEILDQLQLRYFSFLDRLIPIPLLKSWAGWLWNRGSKKGEIEALEGHHLSAYECRVDLESLKKDIKEAIKKKQLCLEGERHEISGESQGRILSDAAHGR